MIISLSEKIQRDADTLLAVCQSSPMQYAELLRYIDSLDTLKTLVLGDTSEECACSKARLIHTALVELISNGREGLISEEQDVISLAVRHELNLMNIRLSKTIAPSHKRER